jgi:hypothetical protein
VALVDGHRLITAETRIRSQPYPYAIYDGRSGTGTCFSSRRSAFPCMFHSTNAPIHVFITVTGQS